MFLVTIRRANKALLGWPLFPKPAIPSELPRLPYRSPKSLRIPILMTRSTASLCHMPNMASADDYSTDQKAAGPKALKRLHTYKINVDPAASTMVQEEVDTPKKAKVKAYVLAKNEDGNAFVDLMWSCARNSPADYTVFEGKGCHNEATSKLDQGLVYQDQKEVYGEVMKWQTPIKRRLRRSCRRHSAHQKTS